MNPRNPSAETRQDWEDRRMTERDRSQEPSNDTEIKAMMSIKRTFEVLDRSARRRVLEWASHRYVDEPLPDFDPDFTKNLARFTEGLAEAARQIGNITPLDIISAANEIARLRDESQPDPAETVQT